MVADDSKSCSGCGVRGVGDEGVCGDDGKFEAGRAVGISLRYVEDVIGDVAIDFGVDDVAAVGLVGIVGTDDDDDGGADGGLDLAVVGDAVTDGGVTSLTGGCGAVVVDSLRENKFRMPPKKLDFFVVGVGIVVVADRISFSPTSAPA